MAGLVVHLSLQCLLFSLVPATFSITYIPRSSSLLAPVSMLLQ